MRAREHRLRRAFQTIVTTMLAGPLAVGAACHASSGEDEPGGDASVTPRDAGPATDATTSGNGSDASRPHDSAPPWDPEACAAETIDGAYFDDNPDGCSTYRLLRCGLPPDPSTSTPPLSGCGIYLGICAEVCPPNFLLCELAPVSCTDAGDVLADARVIVDCVGQCGIAGRPPRGLRASGRRVAATAGAHFADMAYLEAASVRAFRDLERSLTAHGAPLRLRRGARRAAADERRHARLARGLARGLGETTPRLRVARVEAPSLVELVEDDAVAGCVDETFAALLATWQARRAADAKVRRVMTAIAADETRHAALAWEVLHWGLPRLRGPDRARVLGAMEAALARLGRRVAALTEEARVVVGNPTREEQRCLVSEVARLVRREANAAA
jgi:hypothetical protein